MAKQKRRKKSKKTNTEQILKYLIWILSIIITIIALFLGGYYLGYNSAKKEISSTLHKKEQARKAALKKLEQTIKQKQNLHKQLENILAKEQKTTPLTAAHEIENKKVLLPRKKIPPTQHTTHKKPKLAIIFDDVSTAAQVRAIKALGLKVTLSFFPPSPHHPYTPKLASKEPFYMIHLPMEALHFNKEEPFTLHTYDSYETIQQRIKKIKKLFPKVHYINNHTGSKFTSNKHCVTMLLKILQQNNIQFIDSRTTAKTKVPEVSKTLQIPYQARDVFLDHDGDIASIKKQIKHAIFLAKKYGNIIAIGHPHPNTIKALAQSKYLLNQVNLVYVYQIH